VSRGVKIADASDPGPAVPIYWRPSSRHDIVTCQRLVIYSSKAGVKEKLSMSASAVTSAVQRTQMKRRSLPTDTLTSRRQT